MKKQKVLIVRQFEDSRRNFQNIYEEAMIYPYTSTWDRKWKRFLFKFNLRKNWLAESFKNLEIDDYDLIIIEELFSYNPIDVIQYIRKQNSHCHILYWMRNTWFAEKYGTGITEKNIQQFLHKQKVLDFRIISFDKNDCRKYGLIYAHQSLLRTEIDELLLKEKTLYHPQWDLFWYGKDKGRIGKALSIKKYFDDHGLTYNMITLPMKGKQYTSDEKTILTERGLTYREYLEMILKSRATLDILQKGQEGLGARPVETMLFKRKLITDYTGIQEYDFYRKENIFILGEDDFRRLPDFLTSPYQEVPEEIVSRYTFEGMLQNVYKTLGWEWKEPDRKS